MLKITLSKKQQETLDFLKGYIRDHKESPTIATLRQAFKLKSLRSVTQRLESLEDKGFIKRDKFKHKGISLIDINPWFPSGTRKIPVIASAGCDALQVYAQQQYDEFLAVDNDLVDPKKDIVALKAIGNSMVDAKIFNGDYALVEVTNNVNSGDRVVAIIGDMAVIKRLKITPDVILLEPESKGNGYSSIVMKDNSKIFGKVLRTISLSNTSDEPQIIYDNIDAQNAPNNY